LILLLPLASGQRWQGECFLLLLLLLLLQRGDLAGKVAVQGEYSELSTRQTTSTQTAKKCSR
jgi:hypothetical protein